MYSFRIEIARTVFEVKCFYRNTQVYCRAFFTDKAPACNISITHEDLESERRIFEQYHRDGSPTERALEFYRLLRKVSEEIIDFDAFMIHGAAVATNKRAYLFAAESGTGKSTHIFHWMWKKLDEVTVVNGDKPFIRFSSDSKQPLICGSPWAGKENLYTEDVVPLKSIIIMERAEENFIEPLTFGEAFPYLLQQVYRPEDETKMRQTLRLIQRLNGPVSFWRFKCNNFKDDCFDVAYNALVRNQK